MKVFSLYLTLNLVFAMAVLLLIAFAPFTKGLRAGVRLQLHYGLLAFAFVASMVMMWVPKTPPFQPIVKVWAPSTQLHQLEPVKNRGVLQVQKQNMPVSADYFFLFSIGLGLGAGFVGLVYVLSGRRRLQRILQNAFPIRILGKVRILVSEDVAIPFSYRAYNAAYVLLPQYLITNPNSLRLTVAHELQHHRQRDTQWAYAFLLARAVCFFNPFVHFWNRWVEELQEFACDEALVGRHRSLKQAYARCLIEVAETAWVQGSVPHGATGMILLSRGNLLNRRIQFMFKEKSYSGKAAGVAGFALMALMLTATAFAAKGLVQDRRITLAQAQELAKKGPRGSVFPVVVNEEVLKYLNQYLGTPEGRENMRASLRRMNTYRVMVDAKIADYGLPPELAAIPIIESGYQNLEDRNVRGWGAGLWMFIASTARIYGLRVDGNIDQRLDEPLLTDAAMRYLLANRLRFNDWQLSVLAYNAGENAVQQAIDRLGSRDPWALVRDGNLSPEARNYLPKLMAAILIMKNPSSVE